MSKVNSIFNMSNKAPDVQAAQHELTPQFKTWQQRPTKANMTVLLDSLSPVISNAMTAFTKSQSPTLKTKAKVLTAEAIKTYDPQKGTLKNHVYNRLQRLQRLKAKQRQIIQMPEQVAMDQMKLRQATENFQDEYSRDPSDQELADHSGLSMKRMTYIRQGKQPVAESRMSALTEDGQMPDISVRDDDDSAWVEFIYGDLDPTNQYIMERTLGLHGQPVMPIKMIAAKLKISPAAISQRIARVQGILNKRERYGIL